jgi:hypothetical protein
MAGLRFDVDEVARRGLDDPVPRGARSDVDRARHDVSDHVMVCVVMLGSPPRGRLAALHRDGESLMFNGRALDADL